MTTNNTTSVTRPAPSSPKRSKPKRSRTKPKSTRTTAARVPRRRTHFVATHPLAEAARHHCRELNHRADLGRYIGKVACDECWEAAIRADERFAVESDLDDAEPIAPDDDLDEIAMEKAMRGVRVPLTGPERAAAIDRLNEAGLTVHQIARRLRMGAQRVEAALKLAAAAAAETEHEPDRQSAALAA